MQHTTKMVMVPQDAYSNLMSQQKQVYPPVVNQMANLDQELQSIISNPNLSVDNKYHQYMNVFGRYQQLKSQYFQPSPIPQQQPAKTLANTDVQTIGNYVSVPPVDEKHLLDSLPKTVRRRGKILLDHIKENNQDFNWKDSGELVVDGKPIPGSNITDFGSSCN